jgi:hypothetical protein
MIFTKSEKNEIHNWKTRSNEIQLNEPDNDVEHDVYGRGMVT